MNVLLASTLLTNACYGRGVRSSRVDPKAARKEAEEAAAEAIIQIFDMGARLGYDIPGALARALKINHEAKHNAPPQPDS